MVWGDAAKVRGDAGLSGMMQLIREAYPRMPLIAANGRRWSQLMGM